MMSKYVLVLKHNNKKLRVQINNKNYLIYEDSIKDIHCIPNNDFRLKEKLYILNYPLEVMWFSITDFEYKFLELFHSFIKPRQLVIKPINGKVTINVNK